MSDSEEELTSDSEDEDYVPSGGELSEDSEAEGEEEDGDYKPGGKGKKAGRKKQAKKKSSLPVRQSKRGLLLKDEEEEDEEEETGDVEEEPESKDLEAEPEVKEQEKKKKADDLWASFLKDVGGPPARPKTSSAGSLGGLSQKTSSTITTQSQSKPKSKVTVTKVYEFAGEEVKVSEEVDADSIEAKAATPTSDEQTTDNSSTSDPPVPQQSSSSTVPRPGASTVTGVKRPAGGGLGSVLSKINKKPKISTLVKSKLDWDTYKKEEQIEDDLAIHNRGKDGYLERQAFLQRTDLRQFEVERNMRMANRNVPR